METTRVKTCKVRLNTNKEVFDGQLYPITLPLDLVVRMRRTERKRTSQMTDITLKKSHVWIPCPGSLACRMQH